MLKKALGPLLSVGLIVALMGSARGPGGTVVVRIRLIDASSGKPAPAMVCITDAETGTVRLPPDGRESPPPVTTTEFLKGVPFKRDRNWIGPVRKMTGKGNNRDRSYVYGLLPSVPHWREPMMVQTSGDFTIRLPEGRWRIAAARGMEFVPVREEFRTGDGDLEKTFRLERWIDLPSEGWYSGDIHVHHPTTEKAHRDFLLEYADAEDVHVVNALEQHHTGGQHSRQAGFGKKFRVERGGRWLVSGQEAPSSTFGHVIGLNVDRLVHDPKNVDFYDLAFRRIHEQGGALVGYAHFSWNGCSLPRGFPWYVTTRELDFVELMQFAKINAADYYDYLNLGFRLAAAAGSDVPWGSTMGEVRTYVHTGPKLDPDRWFACLKEGRTFVSNGPALEFTVDGKPPGTTLPKKRGDRVRAAAKVRCHPKIGPLRALRLVSNEGTLKEVKPAGGEEALSVELRLPLERSRWIAAAAECANGALAHSSPIYVTVDGQPTWCPDRGPKLIDKQLAAIARIEKEFAAGKDRRSRGIRERLARARAFYAELRRSMKRSRGK